MTLQLDSLRILGVHPVVPTEQQFKEAVEIMYGKGLRRLGLSNARKAVRQHFDNVYLIEIEVSPQGVEPDWSTITQPIMGRPQDEWQVPYDERPLGDDGKRWTCFLHDVDLRTPLRTQLGDVALPQPTPTPPHLQHITYDIPG